MSNKMNYMAVAAGMSPEDFELLLRAFCRVQLDRRAGLRPGPNSWDKCVTVRFELGMDDKHSVTRGNWRVTGLGTDTGGESLAPTMTEYCRRVGWENAGSANLLLATDEARNVLLPPAKQIGLVDAEAEHEDDLP